MIGVLRLSLSYFFLVWQQRWLLVPLGAAGCGIGLLQYLLSGRTTLTFAFGLSQLQLGGLLLAAIAFRAMSTSRSLHLVPHFRLKMLASLPFVPILVALTWYASAPVWLSAGLAAAAPPGATLVAPFALASALVLGIAIGARSKTAGFVILNGYLALFVWRGGAYAAIVAAGLDPVFVAAGASVVAWLGFSAWHLTTTRPAGDRFRPTRFAHALTSGETARMNPRRPPRRP